MFMLASDKAANILAAVPEDTKHVGGLTIFGKNFGNYNQGIHVRIIYN